MLDPLTSVNLVGFGEVLPRFDNFVAIDPTVVDKFGIPVLRITMSWSENEKKMIPDMAVTAAQMMEVAGAKNIQPFTRAPTASPVTASMRWALREWATTARRRC